ncbi:hypothetical protein ABDK09_07855 [Vibrio sp. CDRSL-10 TSBA]
MLFKCHCNISFNIAIPAGRDTTPLQEVIYQPVYRVNHVDVQSSLAVQRNYFADSGLIHRQRSLQYPAAYCLAQRWQSSLLLIHLFIIESLHDRHFNR